MEKRHILIVDDTPANLKTLATMLKKDYKIIFAKSGEEALELVEKCGKPDLILMDIMMPGIDGYEVCRRLKAEKKTAGIPIIFITSKSEHEDRQAGLEAGAEAYITKPFDAATVRHIVRTHLWVSRD